jgi:hypothetical protein
MSPTPTLNIYLFEGPIHMGSKILNLRDNRLKFLPATKGIGWNFLMKRTKIKRSYVQFTKIVKISPPWSMHR